MQNILIAIDVVAADEKTIDFACYLAKVTGSRLTGVFLENLVYADTPVVRNLYGSPFVETILTSDIPENEYKRKACQAAVTNFNAVCRQKGIQHAIHLDRGVPVEELIEESRFADLIIVDTETSFSKKSEAAPTKFVREILADSECPIILAPTSFAGVNEVIFAYDGSKSSVYAIKLFSYLFPQFSDRLTRVVQINTGNENIITEKHKLRGWLNAHYSNIDIVTLHGDPKDELFIYLLNKEDMIVVMGAYGRSWLSQVFSKSEADLVVKSINLPVFIAHC